MPPDGAMLSSQEWYQRSRASHLVCLLGDGRGCPWTVEVDNLPLAIPAVPDARLLWLGGAWHSVGIDVLGDAYIGDAGGLLPDQMNVWVEDGGVNWFAVLGPHCQKRTMLVIMPLLLGLRLWIWTQQNYSSIRLMCIDMDDEYFAQYNNYYSIIWQALWQVLYSAFYSWYCARISPMQIPAISVMIIIKIIAP